MNDLTKSNISFCRGVSSIVTSLNYRLLKNTHLRRSPHPSPCPARGRLVAAYIVGNGLKPFPTRISGAPANGILQGSTCICLPARSRFGRGRGIFDQPEKNESPRLFTPNSLPSPKRFVQAGELITSNCNLVILYICLVVKRIVRVNFKSFIAL